MTKRTENPHEKIFSKNRNQEKILTPYKNQSHKRSKTTNKETPKNNQNKQYDRGKSNTNNEPYHFNNNKTKMTRTRQRNATKNNENTTQRRQQRIKKKKQRTIAVAMTTRKKRKGTTFNKQLNENDHKETMEKNIRISETSLTASIKNL